MSIFSTISYYTNKALDALGIGSDPDEKKTNTQKTTSTKKVSKPNPTTPKAPSKPVIQTKNVKENTDTANFSKEAKQKQAPISGRPIAAIQESIKNKCIKNGIDDRKLIRELKKHSGMRNGEYEKLSEKEKCQVWNEIETLLDGIIEVKNKYGVSNGVALEAILLETVVAYEMDTETGNIPNAKNLMAEAGDINKELNDKNFKNKSKNEQNEILNQTYLRWKTYKEDRINSLVSKCPKAEQAAMRTKLEQQFNKIERIRFAQILTTQDTETSHRALRIMSPQNMALGSKMIANTRINEAETKRYYNDVATFESNMEIFDDFYNRGEKPDNDAVREMTTDLMAGKSHEAMQAYCASYTNARKSGKHENLERDGVFTEIAAGNLAGAQLNKNLSVEERIDFVKKFYESEQQFGDLDVVVEKSNSAINSYLEANPSTSAALRKEVDEIKTKTSKYLATALEKSNAIKKAKAQAKQEAKNKTTAKDVSKPNSTTSQAEASQTSYSHTTTIANSQGIAIAAAEKSSGTQTKGQSVPKELKTPDAIITQGSSDAVIQMALCEGSVTIEEAIQQVKDDKKVYKIISANNNLITKYERNFVNYILKQNKVEDQIALANSIKAIELIRLHSKVDNKEKLYDKLEQKATSIQKNLFKKENENYEAV